MQDYFNEVRKAKYKDGVRYFDFQYTFVDIADIREEDRTAIAMLDACDSHYIRAVGRRFVSDLHEGYDYYLLDSEQQPT